MDLLFIPTTNTIRLTFVITWLYLNSSCLPQSSPAQQVSRYTGCPEQTDIQTKKKGILGREIVHALAKDGQTWTTVHALSRRQKEAYPAHVVHDTVDLFASSADRLAEELRTGSLRETIAAGGVEYIFFTAYLAKPDEGEAAEVNGGMLRNFLQALHRTGGDRKLKRVILTAGAKQYGVHLGPVKLPMEEDDPWVEGPGRPPNFYYTQERVLLEESKGKKWDWVVTFPNDVIGVAKGKSIYITQKKEEC